MKVFYVTVMSRPKARAWSYEPHDFESIVISITDVGSNPNNFNRDKANGIVAVLPLQFDDVNRGGVNCITKEDANKITDFVNCWMGKFEHIVVHCEAGKSRSAGVAAAILKYYTGNDAQIYDSPRYTPNSTCYSMVLESFYENENK